MVDIKTLSLPIPNIEYDENDEAVTRRILEQAIEDTNVRITRVQRLQDTMTSKAVKRNQFLLMGAKHG
tara:strand:- start:434 stop:637 length:204 start_codon:yes stop_codon:yes gene_type:complete